MTELDKLKAKEQKIVQAERKVKTVLAERRQRVFDRFPILFTLLGAFGLVATFYGFERLIDQVDLFHDNPWILLGTGLLTLAGTGTLYKKLQ
jgi:hypothetical protein